VRRRGVWFGGGWAGEVLKDHRIENDLNFDGTDDGLGGVIVVEMGW
jgi:hypothetical protein